MNETLIDIIYNSASLFGERLAFTDPEAAFSYADVKRKAESIACEILRLGVTKRSAALYMERDAKIPVAMAGVLLSGNFYTVLDTESPSERLMKIVAALRAEVIICQEADEELCRGLFPSQKILTFDKAINITPDLSLVKKASALVSPSDTAFVIFTSGSTGTPKGTIITHKNVVAYSQWFVRRFGIGPETAFGSQTPFYFSMSVTDLYGAWMSGASYHIIPKGYFSFPARLIGYLNEKRVNTIYWVPTAMNIVAAFDLFNFEKPLYLTSVFFAGEVMPTRVLNYWRRRLPEATYVNLFGPTETTDICCYFVVDREFANNEDLPIGKACEGVKLLVIGDNGEEIVGGTEKGELYVGGDFVAAGYYGEPQKTAEVFVQNPLNPSPEVLYRTGDLVQYNETGELKYVGRRDSQIKLGGYRIELGEIETVLNAFSNVCRCVCLFDDRRQEIVLLYEGEEELKPLLRDYAAKNLLTYMIPQRIVAVRALPVNRNGKIDRAALKKEYLL